MKKTKRKKKGCLIFVAIVAGIMGLFAVIGSLGSDNEAVPEEATAATSAVSEQQWYNEVEYSEEETSIAEENTEEIFKEETDQEESETPINRGITSAAETTKHTEKSTAKSTTKSTAHSTTKSTTKTAAKTTVKQTTKSTTKTTAKPTTKSTTKTTVKPTTKSTTKTTAKPTTKATTKATTKPTTKPTTTIVRVSDGTYVANINSGKYHYSWCASVARMSESNKRYYNCSSAEMRAMGYEPCDNCNP